jgi:hypothetical protein
MIFMEECYQREEEIIKSLEADYVSQTKPPHGSKKILTFKCHGNIMKNKQRL